jgi:anti-sigma regulatory factor (Ser/Thr protein kinase)
MSGLAHRALIYDEPEQLLAVAEPFVREGIERGEPVMVILGAERERTLRERLGEDAAVVDFRAPSEWYETPPRTLAGYTHYLAAHHGGGRIRALGEPPYPDRSEPVVREWARAEAILTIAFAQAAVDLVCPYDARRLPASIVAHARRTHPLLCDGLGSVPNPDATDPHVYLDTLADRLDEPAGPAAELAFDADPAVVRAFVTEQATYAGLHGEQLEALRVAAGELATNAIVHGRRPRRARVWEAAGQLVCEIEDGGAGVASQLAGYLMPGTDARSGRGLWIARQLCDRVEIEGARMRLHLAPAG